MPERAKTVCICMHAHTNCKLLWQAPYQSLLGGVLVNVCVFHERAGYTLVSAFRLLKLTTTHPCLRAVIACIFIRVHLARDYLVVFQQMFWQLLMMQLYFANVSSATIANALPLHKHCLVFVVPRFLIKRLLLEMPERAKLFALHACSHSL